MGGPVSERADVTDKNPPRLERYDRWGHDISEVVLPPSFLESRRDVLANSFTTPADPRGRAAPRRAPRRCSTPPTATCSNQAEIGMTCALGTGGDMVVNLVRAVRARPTSASGCMAKFASGEWAGQTIQSLTERTGGSDLAEIETTATPDGDAWRHQRLQVVRVERQRRRPGSCWPSRRARPTTPAGIATFLVLRRAARRHAATASASAASRTSSAPRRSRRPRSSSSTPRRSCSRAQSGGEAGAGDGKGLARMMEMTNGARLGIAMMGLGCARRALVEALCYARARTAFGKPLAEQPLMQRKLAELIVDVEAAQALVFDGYDPDAPAAHRRAAHQAARRPPRHHRGERRHRGARRQRLRRELAGRPHPPRRPGQHAVGGPRQHPVPRRAARHRARAGRRRVPRPAARGRRRRRPPDDPTTDLVAERVDHLDDRHRAVEGARPHDRRGPAVPARRVHGRRVRRRAAARAGGLRAARARLATARRSSPASTPGATSPTTVRCAASTSPAARSSSGSRICGTAPSSTTGSAHERAREHGDRADRRGRRRVSWVRASPRSRPVRAPT